MKVHRDGETIDAPGYLTRALLLGDGVFETMRTFSGRLPLLPEHAARLLRSADGMLIRHGFSREHIESAVRSAVASTGTEMGKDILIRVILTSDPELVVLTEPFTGYPERIYTEGVRLQLSPYVRVERSSFPPEIKTTSYAPFFLAWRHAVSHGFDDAILVDREGRVCETTRSNLFILQDGLITTPPEGSCIFPGITRSCVIELARISGQKVREAPLTVDDLCRAEEVFLTSSLLGVAPVRSIGAHVCPRPVPGRTTRALRDAYLSLMGRKGE